MSDTLDNLRTALAGRYRIERQLGAGGMATVYLARDLKHGRQVAIKVLRPELAAVIGARRFLHEIATVAVLQHPRILGLIDSGEANGTAWYVMPYVDGESLRERLNREKQLPVSDAVRITAEVASALDYAHRQGVIHRDIKPENILLQDGQALVADFGIALAVSAVGGKRLTETGLSLGTPHYMSPEQATGEREITARSDIFSLGVVTYEMLAGDPPFSGSTAQAVIGKVLADDPVPLRRHRRTVPEQVDEAVSIALEKLPADRFATATAFAERLVTPPTGMRAVPPAPRRAAWQVGLVLLAGTLGLLAGLFLARGESEAGGTFFGRGTRLSWQPGLEIQPAISPDGRFVAYAGGTATATRIFVRQISGGRVIQLTGDSTIQSSPTWSPDGTRILYLAHGVVFSAPASGGPARQEVRARTGNPVLSAEWNHDASAIAFAAGDSLFVQRMGDTARFLAEVRSPNTCRWSPDDRKIACASGNTSFASIGSLFGNLAVSAIVSVSVPDGRRTYLTDSAAVNQTPVWSPDGDEVYFISNRDGPLDIYRVHADGGDPRRLTTGLSAYAISLSGDGRHMVYTVLRDVGNVWSLPLGPEPLSFAQAEPVTHGTLPMDAFSISRDGQWILYSADLAGNGDLFRMPIGGGEIERLTVDPAGDFAPDLSPGPRPEVVFHSWREGTRDIFVLPLDGGALQKVVGSSKEEVLPRWSPDGSAVVWSYFDPVGGVGITRREADGSWGESVMRSGGGGYASWSPDGRMLVYVNPPMGGTLEVVPVDSGAPRVVVDPSQAGMPTALVGFYTRDGTSIMFLGRESDGIASIWRVPAEGGTPQKVVTFDDPAAPVYRPFWALTANRMYFIVQEQQSETWVVDVRQP